MKMNDPLKINRELKKVFKSVIVKFSEKVFGIKFRSGAI